MTLPDPSQRQGGRGEARQKNSHEGFGRGVVDHLNLLYSVTPLTWDALTSRLVLAMKQDAIATSAISLAASFGGGSPARLARGEGGPAIHTSSSVLAPAAGRSPQLRAQLFSSPHRSESCSALTNLAMCMMSVVTVATSSGGTPQRRWPPSIARPPWFA